MSIKSLVVIPVAASVGSLMGMFPEDRKCEYDFSLRVGFIFDQTRRHACFNIPRLNYFPSPAIEKNVQIIHLNLGARWPHDAISHLSSVTVVSKIVQIRNYNDLNV